MNVMVFALLASLAMPAQVVETEPHVILDVQGRGRIQVRLRSDESPLLVAHFVKLVQADFYDGLLFHRKVDGFVIQAGDPKTRGLSPAWARAHPGEYGGTEGYGDGGSGTTVAYRINNLTHKKYTMGMALEAPMSDTADSQFFINLADNFRLNGLYEVFGEVVSGYEVVDRVERGDRIRQATIIRVPK